MRRAGSLVDNAHLIAFHLEHGGTAEVVGDTPLLGASAETIVVDGTPVVRLSERLALPGVRVTCADAKVVLIACRRAESADEMLRLAREIVAT